MKKTLSGGLVHEMPADLATGLFQSEEVNIWESLSPIGRNEFICWVEDAKQAKTRSKRILRAVEEPREGKKRPCCWVGCIHRTDKKPSKWQQDVLIDKNLKNDWLIAERRSRNSHLHVTLIRFALLKLRKYNRNRGSILQFICWFPSAT